jgi:hypothetical protein
MQSAALLRILRSVIEAALAQQGVIPPWWSEVVNKKTVKLALRADLGVGIVAPFTALPMATLDHSMAPNEGHMRDFLSSTVVASAAPGLARTLMADEPR